jgi:hypothetical protein
MHHPMKELPIVEDYGEGFCSRLVEWGRMIVSETFPKGVDATPQQTIDVVAKNLAAAG